MMPDTGGLPCIASAAGSFFALHTTDTEPVALSGEQYDGNFR